MRTITTFYGIKIYLSCIGCEIAGGVLKDYCGSLIKKKYFHAHQDIEIGLPGFIIISSLRHISSIAEFSSQEQSEFISMITSIRRAQLHCGFKEVYIFQNENSVDHFHTWLFPIHQKMKKHGLEGISLISAALKELKNKTITYNNTEVFSTLEKLKLYLSDDAA